MKRISLLIVACILALTLSACGGAGGEGGAGGTEESSKTSVKKEAVATSAQASDAVVTAADTADGTAADSVASTAPATSDEPEGEGRTAALAADDVEIDMTKMNATMVYTQVSDMMTSPDDYLGKTVRMSGQFAVYEGDMRNYYACVIADATACCAQGIEFVLDGEYRYPEDYPKLGTEVTVVGVFDSYYEGANRYIQLINAELG